MIQLDIWSDVACPWCLLGKARLEAALAGREATVRWHAFELSPHMPLDGEPIAVLERKLGGKERLRFAQAHIAKLGLEVGIRYAFDKQTRVSNTRLAHRALALAGEKKVALVDALFRAHFEEGVDVSPMSAVLDVASRVGLDRATLEAALRGDGGLAEVLADEAEAQDMQIGGVPFFVANGKLAMSGAQDVETFRDFLRQA